jgi:sulfite oxidase
VNDVTTPVPAIARSEKDARLRVLGREPLVLETPLHLLDDETTPEDRFFVRNNGLEPAPVADPEAWSFSVDGEVERPLRLALGDLKRRYEPKTLRMVLECGGNGRSAFVPLPPGNPWTQGGVGCAVWTGVPLADVLHEAGLTESARFTAHYGADPHVSGDPGKPAISRGVPIAKALEEHTLLAWDMNGQPLPPAHGGPLRLVVPGWPGSLSQKWLTRIWIRDREHDGPGMTGTSYRVPSEPIAPGSDGSGVTFRVLESMPVRSILTCPAGGTSFPSGTRQIAVQGAAWAGDGEVARVDLSSDYGATWAPAILAPPRNRYDWVRFAATLTLPSDGYFEIWARATDTDGHAQPFRPANWNPHGYGCNAMQPVTITIGPRT